MKRSIAKILIFSAVFLSLVGCSKEVSVSEDQVKDAISSSEDFSKYEEKFLKSTASLIRDGKCSLMELKEQGGWAKSVINHKYQPVYFIYCGGLRKKNRIYLNVENEKIL